MVKILCCALFALVALVAAQGCPQGTCPTQDTCCQLDDGSWGCCPYPKADCCADHEHCCPSGYSCDLSKGQCVQASKFSMVIANKPFTSILRADEAAPSCPAGTCPSSDTCCSAGTGQWGCCPYPKADCCSDHKHCCPNGYTCDLSKGQCDKGASPTGVIATKTLAELQEPEDAAPSCPAGTCPSSDTCCSAGSGQWGCCPYPKADCCSDHKHCCPNGYQCDLSKGQCTKSPSLMGLVVTKPLTEITTMDEAESMEDAAPSCPAGTCPSSDTCCSAGSGQWGCCPYPKADCCSDHKHCCPNGYQCDLSKGQCTKSPSLMGIVVTKPLTEIVSMEEAAPSCPAGTCPSSDTCCSAGTGQWGCCPYPKADCCSDHKHCCPNGYTCDLSKGQCVKAGSATMVKIPLRPLLEPKE